MSDSICWFRVVSFSIPIVNRRATTTRKRRTIINGLFFSLSYCVCNSYIQLASLLLSLFFVLYKRKPCKSWNRPFFKQTWNSILMPPPMSKYHSSLSLSHSSSSRRKDRHWHILYVQISIDSTRWSANYSDVRLQLIRRKKKTRLDVIIDACDHHLWLTHVQ